MTCNKPLGLHGRPQLGKVYQLKIAHNLAAFFLGGGNCKFFWRGNSPSLKKMPIINTEWPFSRLPNAPPRHTMALTRVRDDASRFSQAIGIRNKQRNKAETTWDIRRRNLSVNVIITRPINWTEWTEQSISLQQTWKNQTFSKYLGGKRAHYWPACCKMLLCMVGLLIPSATTSFQTSYSNCKI